MKKETKTLHWSIWMDPEDNSVTVCLQGEPHYGSDQSVEVHQFQTTADTVDKHLEMMADEREYFLTGLERE